MPQNSHYSGKEYIFFVLNLEAPTLWTHFLQSRVAEYLNDLFAYKSRNTSRDALKNESLAFQKFTSPLRSFWDMGRKKISDFDYRLLAPGILSMFIWRGSFNCVTWYLVFAQQIFMVNLLCGRHWTRKWGCDSHQAQHDCCPRGMGDDATVIKLSQTFASKLKILTR